MLRLFCFLIFFSHLAHADYEQVIKPVKGIDSLSFSLYQLKQRLNTFYKNTSQPKMISSDIMNATFVLPNPTSTRLCKDPKVFDNSVNFEISRTGPSTSPKGIQIRESLTLKVCGISLELFSLERQGANLKALSNDEIFRGNLPDNKNVEYYNLKLVNRQVVFEMTKTGENELMNLSILDALLSPVIYFKSEETNLNGILQRQFLNLQYFVNERLQEDDSAEYIWNTDPKTMTPRQYLFFQNREISPENYLLLSRAFYNQSIYPLIAAIVDFRHSPL